MPRAFLKSQFIKDSLFTQLIISFIQKEISLGHFISVYIKDLSKLECALQCILIFLHLSPNSRAISDDKLAWNISMLSAVLSSRYMLILRYGA